MTVAVNGSLRTTASESPEPAKTGLASFLVSTDSAVAAACSVALVAGFPVATRKSLAIIQAWNLIERPPSLTPWVFRSGFERHSSASIET